MLSVMDYLNAGMGRLDGCSKRWVPKNLATGTGIFLHYFSNIEKLHKQACDFRLSI